MIKNNKKNKINIFSSEKVDNHKKITILGFTVFEEIQKSFIRKQEFLGKLISTKKLYSPIKERKVFKIFNIPISERIIKDDVMQYNLLGLTLKKMHLSNHFYNKYLKKVKYDYDDVYILNANSGEIYLFCAYCAKAFLHKNNSHKPLFVATKKYHKDILKLYFPKVNCIYVKDSVIVKTKTSKWEIENHNTYMIFTANHFENVEKETYIKEIGQVHYLNNIKEFLNLKDDEYTKPNATISKEIKISLAQKLKAINLNLSKFVILAPEANSCKGLSWVLWQNIAKNLHKRGFDIFLNVVKNNIDLEYCKKNSLTYQEIFELATKAKAVISLRSGLTEFLLPTNIPNITIYSPFGNRSRYIFSTDKTMSSFSMHKFPFVNHNLICELNFDDYENDEQLLKAIMEKFDNKVVREAQVV